MPTISLPDGKQQQHAKAVSVLTIAEAIGAGLARAALAGKVNGQLVDLSYEITDDAEVMIITDRDPAGLEIIRHSTAHLMAHAVKRLYPAAQVTIGPVIDNGFYYDFAYEPAFIPDDLAKIEAEMAKLAKADLPVQRKLMTRAEAIDFFRQQGEEYKVKIIEDIPEQETLSFYSQGDFTDLCRGPHVPSTGKLKAFKLMKVAGAYWRGDPNNEMLQRIYGTAWADKKSLKQYLHRLEEAEKRDHRKIAKAQDLFHFQEEAPGMAFWHDNGWVLYQVIQQYLREQLRKDGYQEVRTPQIADKSLWEKSGHIAMFSEEMFITESENHIFAVKPMNCPLHIQIFKHSLRSYRDLPLRISEFGSCHRNEISGALHGLMRVRNFVQDDAHIFCTEDQVQAEAAKFIRLLQRVYRDFGFDDIIVKLSTRPDKRIGDDALWDKAEQALAAALDHTQLPWEEMPGEGAFYGPKIDFSLRDCLDRVWQCGTLQLDYSLPERLGAHFIAENGDKQVPVMLHRAIFGSFERFIGVLIEHYGGFFPVWLAPCQAVIMNITDNQADYAKKIAEKLKNLGVRVRLDLRNEKIGYKIREQTLKRVPYQLIIGDKEVAAETMAVRTQGGQDLGAMAFDDFYTLLTKAIAQKGRQGNE